MLIENALWVLESLEKVVDPKAHVTDERNAATGPRIELMKIFYVMALP
jgi:hypothetical protein